MLGFPFFRFLYNSGPLSQSHFSVVPLILPSQLVRIYQFLELILGLLYLRVNDELS